MQGGQPGPCLAAGRHSRGREWQAGTYLLASSPSTAAAPSSRGHSGQGGAQLRQLLRGAAQKLQNALQGRVVQVGLAQA